MKFLNFSNLPILLGSFVTLAASADLHLPMHDCLKPKEMSMESDAFTNDINSYKDCIQAFITEQIDQMKIHRKAAEEARDEWNDFIQYEIQ